jgi:pyrroloquinoline quinone biosynthesis protein D
VFGGEAVILRPAENAVVMLDEVGSRIWQLADGTRTVADIAAELTREYAVEAEEARSSVERFVEDLVERELLAWA